MAKSLMDRSERHNIDLNAKDDDGLSAAMHICNGYHNDILKFLLKYSNDNQIDWNARDKMANGEDGDNGLMIACRNHHPETVKLLLKYAESKGIEVPEPDDFFYIEQPTIDLLEKYMKRKKRNCNIFKKLK